MSEEAGARRRVWLLRARDGLALALAFRELVEATYYIVPALQSGQQSLFALAYALNPVGQGGLYIALLAGWWLVVRRTLPLWVFCALIVFGFKAEEARVIDGWMFDGLSAIGIRPTENPQWIKMVLIIWATVILGALISFRKTRTLDRLFMTVILSAIVSLITLFHLVLIEGGLRAVKRNSADLMAAVIRTPEPIYSDLCARLDLNCFGWADGQTPPDFTEKERLMILPMVDSTRGKPEVWHSWLWVPAFSFTNQIQAGYYRRGAENRIIINDGPLSHATWQFQAWFYMLQIPAVFGWLFGGLMLMGLHKRAFARRASPRPAPQREAA